MLFEIGASYNGYFNHDNGITQYPITIVKRSDKSVTITNDWNEGKSRRCKVFMCNGGFEMIKIEDVTFYAKDKII